MKCSSGVNKTGSVNKTSVNKSNEASEMEGTTIPVVSAEMNPVENGAGLAVATVLVPPSELPSSLPSGALPEAAGSLEPLGPRKASTSRGRKERPVSTLWKVWRRSVSTLGRRCSRGALKSNSCDFPGSELSVAHLPLHRWLS